MTRLAEDADDLFDLPVGDALADAAENHQSPGLERRVVLKGKPAYREGGGLNKEEKKKKHADRENDSSTVPAHIHDSCLIYCASVVNSKYTKENILERYSGC